MADNVNRMPKPTICWECSKAVLGCNWSRYFVPIEGWKAEQRLMPGGANGPILSYRVDYCPEFDRDAAGYGAKRLLGRKEGGKA